MTRVHLYHDPNTSEAAGEWDTFLAALCEASPQSGQSQIVSNGDVLTRVVFDGGWRSWSVTPDGFARLIAEREMYEQAMIVARNVVPR